MWDAIPGSTDVRRGSETGKGRKPVSTGAEPCWGVPGAGVSELHLLKVRELGYLNVSCYSNWLSPAPKRHPLSDTRDLRCKLGSRAGSSGQKTSSHRLMRWQLDTGPVCLEIGKAGQRDMGRASTASTPMKFEKIVSGYNGRPWNLSGQEDTLASAAWYRGENNMPQVRMDPRLSWIQAG